MHLGQLYELGRGVPQSASIAHEWCRRASGLASSGAGFVAAAPPPSELELLRARLVDRRRDAEALAEERRRLGDALREDEQATLDARSTALAATISRLESQLADAERRHGAAAAEPAPVDLAGPSIQILDPPIPLQRGIAMVALPPVAKRSIVGRVDAAGGLHRLTVNGRETQTQEDGIFRAELEIPKSSLEVRVVAVDERGKSAELRFELAALEDPSRAPPAPATEASDVGFGDYFALVIGPGKGPFSPRRDASCQNRTYRWWRKRSLNVLLPQPPRGMPSTTQRAASTLRAGRADVCGVSGRYRELTTTRHGPSICVAR
jgi:hypothetical protein